MPRRRRLPYLLRERTRHGKTVHYVRKADGPRVRIYGEYGSKEFMASYHAALAGNAVPQRKPTATNGTLGWLISAYHQSPAWARLSAATRRQREGIFRSIESPDVPLAEVTPLAIRGGMGRRKPCAAEAFLITMKVLLRWALDHEHIESDPTAGLRTSRQKSDGFHTWSEAEIARFEARWPIGTKERLAMSILLYTGLRRGDACALGRQHIRGGVITIRTEKTGQLVTIPLLPELARIIKATPTGGQTFIADRHGLPVVSRSFGRWFAKACKAAGVLEGRAHGLRKAGATRAAENGATVSQLEFIFGWKGGRMASLYTRQADRAKLARDAMEKLLTPHRV